MAVLGSTFGTRLPMNTLVPMSRPTSRTSPRTALLCATLAALALFPSGCASVSFERESATSGTFQSTGWAFTIASIDLPRPALQIARENASDSGLANMQIETSTVFPDWGWWNWVLDIISVRRAQVSGTWGFSGER